MREESSRSRWCASSTVSATRFPRSTRAGPRTESDRVNPERSELDAGRPRATRSTHVRSPHHLRASLACSTHEAILTPRRPGAPAAGSTGASRRPSAPIPPRSSPPARRRPDRARSLRCPSPSVAISSDPCHARCSDCAERNGTSRRSGRGQSAPALRVSARRRSAPPPTGAPSPQQPGVAAAVPRASPPRRPGPERTAGGTARRRWAGDEHRARGSGMPLAAAPPPAGTPKEWAITASEARLATQHRLHRVHRLGEVREPPPLAGRSMSPARRPVSRSGAMNAEGSPDVPVPAVHQDHSRPTPGPRVARQPVPPGRTKSSTASGAGVKLQNAAAERVRRNSWKTADAAARGDRSPIPGAEQTPNERAYPHRPRQLLLCDVRCDVED